MFIRTVTFFVNTYRRDLSIDISRREIKEAFEEYEVYNIRLSISPPRSIEELHERLKEMLKLDFDYFGGIGSIGVNDLSVEIIKALKHDDRLTGFISVESIEESIEAARLVKEHLYRDTAAARLLIGINPPRFSPYLPYSFVLDPSIDIGFSVAINRVADLREVASRDLGELREAIVKILSKHIPRIEALSKRLEREIDAKYLGIDVSLAPMPGIKDESVGELLYNITGSTHGILPYIYFINKTLDDLPIVFSRVGYNRVMTPLGEDHKLAELAREGSLTLDTLKARSSVCSTGIDVVPIEKDLVEAIVADTISIGMAQKKPIGARLIPWDAGEEVDLGAIGSAPVLTR